MGLFGKRKARKEAEAKQSGKWDNPTNPAYKQKGFNAGEGTGKRNGSGPNKSGDDNYTPPARKSSTPEKRKPNKAVSLETKKPKAINTDTEAPKLTPRTDTKPKENAAMFRARKKAELESAKKAQVAKQKKVTADKAKVVKDKDTEKAKNTYKQGEQLGTPKSTKPKPKKVKNEEMTNRAGHVVNYSENELKSKKIAKGNTRATANRKAKGAVKSGETYTYINSKGKKVTAKKP